ncbi:hypothetical protein SHXM_00006 [Streptomyces hygroscopicus]|nr:hypothetical protein SHXM_00006 [Streptomyces hygroscopicus]
MPEPLRRPVHQLVSETVQQCQEVLRYTEPDRAHDWKRMTLYRATDAADTMDMASMLIAAYCQHVGMSKDRLESYLQLGQQHSRAAGPTDADRSHVAGLLGEETPAGADRSGLVRMRYGRGERQAEKAQRPEEDPQKLFTEACLHGLRAKLCDDLGSLDLFPPEVAAMARRVAECLEVPEPATA